MLDASAVLCWLKDEPGAERVEAILGEGEQVLIHAVNMVEVQYQLLRRGDRFLRVGLEQVEAAGVQLVQTMDDKLLTTAAHLKAHFAPIALGDVFGAALAKTRDGTLVTTDRSELEKVGSASFCIIEFLR